MRQFDLGALRALEPPEHLFGLGGVEIANRFLSLVAVLEKVSDGDVLPPRGEDEAQRLRSLDPKIVFGGGQSEIFMEFIGAVALVPAIREQ